MSSNPNNLDKAGVDHWDSTERNTDIPLESFEPLPGVRGFGRRLWHETLTNALAHVGGPSAELLELGCGGSALLPYFANRHKFSVSGIDYSRGGIEIAQKICAAHGVNATLIQADFFDAPSDLFARFDAVVSFGVVEHFSDTNETINAFARFVRPGGKLITVVPNMAGLSGFGQKLLSRNIYEMHEVIDPSRLMKAHTYANLTIESCGYFMFNNFGVINPGNAPGLVRSSVFSAMRAVTGMVWAVETVVGKLTPNAVTSPYVICVASKPHKSQ